MVRTSRRQDPTRRPGLPDLPRFPDFTPMPEGTGSRASQAPDEGRGGYQGASVAGRAATSPASATLPEPDRQPLAQDQLVERDNRRSAAIPAGAESQAPQNVDMRGMPVTHSESERAADSDAPNARSSSPVEPAVLPIELAQGLAAQQNPPPAIDRSPENPPGETSAPAASGASVSVPPLASGARVSAAPAGPGASVSAPPAASGA